MLPKLQDLILKERVNLYSNLAQIDDCTGRLSVELKLYPLPHIAWEFEVLGDTECTALHYGELGKPTSPFSGHWFSIEKPLLSGLGRDAAGPRAVLRGSTAQVAYGDLDVPAHFFTFYLPNARFQEQNLAGQQSIIKRLEEGKEREDRGFGSVGRSVEASLDNIWSIRLEIHDRALDWLKLERRNIGSLITTFGTLSSYNVDAAKEMSERPTLTLRETLDWLRTLSILLSHANGGYLGPLYVEAFQRQPARLEVVSASALNYHTTPLEQLGTSWIAIDSDLPAYLRCFSTLHRMVNSSPWDDTFDLILSWYFQAIHLGKRWPIIANAVGTALERLSYTVLVLEERDNTKRLKAELLFEITKQNKAKKDWRIGKKYGGEDISVTGKRLQLLLERIGLTKDRGYEDTDDVKAFLEVRNEATHPKPGVITYEERNQLLHQATQWIDEVLLWRLGYNGKYLDRSQKWRLSREPRYDLSTRDPNW